MLKFLAPIYFFWGFNWVVMKTANTFFPAPAFVAWRFGSGALCLILVCLLMRLKMPAARYLPWIALSGIMQMGCNSMLVQLSLEEINSGLGAVLNYSMPVWMLLPAHFLLKERITLRKAVSIITCVAGLCILLGVNTERSSTVSIIESLASAWCWCLGAFIMKLKLSHLPPVQLTTLQMVSGAAFAVLYNIAIPQPPVNWAPLGIACLVFNGVFASALAFLLWAYVLQHMDASKASVAVVAAPVVGVISGIICLGETFTLSNAIGMLLIAAGILGAVIQKKSVYEIKRE